jgi:hypothetical protein
MKQRALQPIPMFHRTATKLNPLNGECQLTRVNFRRKMPRENIKLLPQCGAGLAALPQSCRED